MTATYKGPDAEHLIKVLSGLKLQMSLSMELNIMIIILSARDLHRYEICRQTPENRIQPYRSTF